MNSLVMGMKSLGSIADNHNIIIDSPKKTPLGKMSIIFLIGSHSQNLRGCL